MTSEQVSYVTDPPGHVALRGVRLLTNCFAWLGGIAFMVQLLVADGGLLRFPLAVLVAIVLCSWWLRPDGDSWPIAVVEGIAAAGGVLLLPVPQPVIAFLFGVTTRRALRGGPGRFPPKASLASLGYVTGLVVSITTEVRARHEAVDIDAVAASLMPLVGLVIGSIALYETVRAVRFEEDARRTVAAVLQASPVGLVLLDDDGTPRLHNARARALFGWDTDEPGDRKVPCAHGADITRCAEGCRDAHPEPVEVTIGRAGVLAVHAVPVEQVSGPEQTLVAAVDVSKRRRLEDALRSRAERDDLTGLASRAHFLHLVDSALLVDETAGLLVIDLDQFKEINDADGHQAGDSYLRAAAQRIGAAIGPTSTAARLGGDEFAVLAPGHDAQEATRLATHLLSELEAGPDLVIRASIGIAVATPGVGTAELLRDADTAMYVAKREGGGRIRLFRPEMGERVLARQRDKADLRTAVHGGQLVLHYQPIVDLTTSVVTGAEALVRWQRPGRGLLGPGEFIGLAEETGLIMPLGDKVLAAACHQAVRWHDQGRALDITVNVSTRQLATAAFLPALDRVLATTGLASDRLTIEVTESVWADDAAMRGLMAVRETGVRVALDDFGTGYSSLSYLQRYPFDVVKIDRSFTHALEDSGRTAGVVRCIIDLAEVLGAHTVAEGIETSEQADWLRRAGCAFAQGYLFGKPDHADNWDSQPSVSSSGCAVFGTPDER